MFQHVKQYRKQYKLTQEALGELLGMNPKFIYCLEKNRARVGDQVYTPQEEVVLKSLFGDTPKTQDYYQGLPTITGDDLYTIRKQKHMTQEQAGNIIGISGSHWGQIEAGKSPEDVPSLRRWYTLLVIHHFPEYFQHNDNLTPAHEMPIVEAQVLTPEPETPALDDLADQPGLIPFAYGSQKVRVKWIDGEPWFMLSDVCKAIGYQSLQHATGLIRERDLQKVECIDSLGRNQSANFISERGMSQFFLRARVPAVEPFQDWVFDEVLPSIRKTGGYQSQPAQFDQIDAMILSLTEIKAVKAQQAQLIAEVASIKEQVSRVNYLEVAKPDRSDVVEIVKSELEEEKVKQKVHYRKRKALEKRVSEVAWKAIERTGGSHKDVIMAINKRIKKALAGAYGYAISRERYTDDDFDMAYRVIAVCESEIKDFPQQGQIDFGGAA